MLTIGKFSTDATVNFTPPGAGDWVLVVDAADSQPPKKSGGGATDPVLLMIMLGLSGLGFRRRALRR
jgi:hypothetical protein